MTFSVDPHALDGYAALLGRARDDAQQCKAYFAANVVDLSPGGDGLINPIVYKHVTVQQKLGAMLDHLVTLLDSSCEQMTEAATEYRRTDHKSAARIDNTYPEVKRVQGWRDR
ncbi:hypothetical protein EV385_3008 [Krasilnikovia cinnamomea]|uniref:Excreted virulence factor EspC (Type VII ESX diderm) n=1 Tax=Krasilnikovia cinnamomea TaxID=349313 RepID=A0A4Q7ZJX1_9ACTN|nr:hypothetical protein [Krasilnikovia cinnamomea]RZU51200.1 hypothetical protein EV385_3008 [Krasilnikovia cinnamomea]